MTEQEVNKAIPELQAKIITIQSRSFELVDAMTKERDEARQGITNLDNILKNIVELVGIENPTVDNLMEEVSRLKQLDSPTYTEIGED